MAGDFERFQGKWMLQGVGPPGSGSSSSSSDGEVSWPRCLPAWLLWPTSCLATPACLLAFMLPPAAHLPPHPCPALPQFAGSGATQTQLKYAVEIVIPRSTRMLGVLEPLLERTVFEDVPANLAAIKQRVESMQVSAWCLWRWLASPAGEMQVPCHVCSVGVRVHGIAESVLILLTVPALACRLSARFSRWRRQGSRRQRRRCGASWSGPPWQASPAGLPASLTEGHAACVAASTVVPV